MPGIRSRLVLVLLVLVVLRLGAQEEENLDDLFSDPVEDTIAEVPATDHLSRFVTQDTIAFSGSFNAKGGAIAGWTRYPLLGDLLGGFDGTVGLVSTVTLSFDARPDPDFRLFGTVSTSIDPVNGSYTWPAFALSELFIDYTWLGDVFIRMGKHSVTWGQGRLFEAITNIMADASSGFALRASLPTLLNGVSAIGLMKSGYFESGTLASYKQVCYALKADQVLWGTMLSLGGRYQVDEGLNAILSVKRVVLGVDLLADAVLHESDGSRYFRALAGFFKEWQDVKLYGEYYYTGAAAGEAEHLAGLAVGFNNVFDTPVDLGAQWLHALSDGSGTVTAGLTWSPWKFITVTVAVPVVYGEAGTHFILANDDPAKRLVSIALGLEMAVSF